MDGQLSQWSEADLAISDHDSQTFDSLENVHVACCVTLSVGQLCRPAQRMQFTRERTKYNEHFAGGYQTGTCLGQWKRAPQTGMTQKEIDAT
jgi:hypothetical protein